MEKNEIRNGVRLVPAQDIKEFNEWLKMKSFNIGGKYTEYARNSEEYKQFLKDRKNG